jgi:hypothetical protein
MPDTTETAEKQQVLAVDGKIRFVKNEFTRSKDGTEGKIPAGWGFAVPQMIVPELEIEKGTSPEKASELRGAFENELDEVLSAVFSYYGKNDIIKGKVLLLDEINSQISSRIRTMVSNKQTDYKGADGVRQKSEYYRDLASKRPDRILFTVTEAKEWYPGMRAETDKALAKQAVAASQTGNVREALRVSFKLIFKDLTAEQIETRVDETLKAQGVAA